MATLSRLTHLVAVVTLHARPVLRLRALARFVTNFIAVAAFKDLLVGAGQVRCEDTRVNWIYIPLRLAVTFEAVEADTCTTSAMGLGVLGAVGLDVSVLVSRSCRRSEDMYSPSHTAVVAGTTITASARRRRLVAVSLVVVEASAVEASTTSSLGAVLFLVTGFAAAVAATSTTTTTTAAATVVGNIVFERGAPASRPIAAAPSVLLRICGGAVPAVVLVIAPDGISAHVTVGVFTAFCNLLLDLERLLILTMTLGVLMGGPVLRHDLAVVARLTHGDIRLDITQLPIRVGDHDGRNDEASLGCHCCTTDDFWKQKWA